MCWPLWALCFLLLFSGVALLGWLGWQEGRRLPQREYASSEIADAMLETADGLALGAHTPQEWMDGYAWAMVLDDAGAVRWSYELPKELNHTYTAGEIARFARWYLADYPVFCWEEPYGLFVIGLPRGSLWRYSVYSSPELVLNMAGILPAAALGMLLLGLALCLWLSWRGAKRLETVANGLDALAQGQSVQLPTNGFAGGTGGKAEPDRRPAAGQKRDARPAGQCPHPMDRRGQPRCAHPASPDHGLGGAAGAGRRNAGGLPAEGDRHTNPVRKSSAPS